MNRHRYLLATPFAVLVLLAVLLASCAERSDPDEGLSVLNRSVSTDPESLDPQRARSTQAGDVLRDIGEGLIGYTATGEVVGAGAVSWDISDDGLSYSFKLRPDARWSNGDPVVASDYVLGLQRLVDPGTAAFYAGSIGSIVNANEIIAGEMSATALGVEAVDDTTLRISLAQPTPYLLSLLTHPSTFPVNPGAIEEYGEAFVKPGNQVSNGAYVLESWATGSLIRLRRNEYYWDNTNTGIDVVKHHIVSQETAELNRYRAGELHFTSSVPPEGFAQTQAQFGDQLRIAPYLGVYYYGFILDKPPFKDNLALRQALSMAVDRKLLVEKITGRGEAPAYSWVPPGVANYEPPVFTYAKLTQDERNAIARSLYSQAGYSDSNPLRFELLYNTSETQERIALAIQSMWKDVLGAEVELVNEEFQVMLSNVRQGKTDMFRLSWTGDFNDAVNFLGVMEPGAPSNLFRYESSEYKELLNNAASQVDPQKRRLFLEEAERVMLADHVAIPIYFYVSKHLVSPEVEGWGDNVLDYHYSRHLKLAN